MSRNQNRKTCVSRFANINALAYLLNCSGRNSQETLRITTCNKPLKLCQIFSHFLMPMPNDEHSHEVIKKTVNIWNMNNTIKITKSSTLI
jgi:hypothetical protein